MLRCGKNNYVSNKKIFKRRALSLNKSYKRVSFYYTRKRKLTKLKTLYYIPTYWNKTLLKPLNNSNYFLLYLSSDLYFFKFIINRNNLELKVDLNSNVLSTRAYFEPFFKSFFIKNLEKTFRSFSYWFYTKLKIKGKGYYVYKNYRNTLTHQLGHSHRRYIYSYFVFMKFLSKTTIYLAGLSKSDILTIGRLLRSSKYMNIFTGRGVRFIKQVVYKKTGKVSTYR